MEVRGVVVVSMAHVTSFRLFYERVDLPVFASVVDGRHTERVGIQYSRVFSIMLLDPQATVMWFLLLF